MKALTDKRGQHGFTLIEVVVAFAIFALCIGALYETFAGATRRGTQARARELELLEAQSVLSQLRVQPGPWDGRSKGDLPGGFAWQIDAAPLQAAADEQRPWHAYQVTVRIHDRRLTAGDVELRSIEWVRSRL